MREKVADDLTGALGAVGVVRVVAVVVGRGRGNSHVRVRAGVARGVDAGKTAVFFNFKVGLKRSHGLLNVFQQLTLGWRLNERSMTRVRADVATLVIRT